MSDYPELTPHQQKVLKKFQGRGAVQLTGRHSGKSWDNEAMQRLMDDLVNRPVEDLRCSTGTIFGHIYHTVEPVGGNLREMKSWCVDTYGKVSTIWETMTDHSGLGRWYIDSGKFWFLDEKDREWFILRWS
jgi:hypothetical protein